MVTGSAFASVVYLVACVRSSSQVREGVAAVMIIFDGLDLVGVAIALFALAAVFVWVVGCMLINYVRNKRKGRKDGKGR